MEWILTKDRKPSFEECNGKTIAYHKKSWSNGLVYFKIIEDRERHEILFGSDWIDRYILLDIPDFVPEVEPLRCRVCGCTPTIAKEPENSLPFKIECAGEEHIIALFAPTRTEAITLWNKHNA